MNRPGRRLVGLFLAGIVMFTSGCFSDLRGVAERLRGTISQTSNEARAFIYSEEDATRSVVVRGVIEDDYRYKARVSIDDVEVLDEVAADDALAVRLLAPEAMADFLSDSAPGGGSVPVIAPPTARSELEVLQSRQWIMDPRGAPELTSPGLQQRRPGTDPILDALTALSYVDQASREATNVRTFNPEALDYIAREDDFPKPEKGSAVTRYDFVAPELTAFSETTTSGLPDVPHFRRMSVYVKAGRIVHVLEEINVANRLDDLAQILDLEFPQGTTVSQQRRLLAEGLNQLRAARRLLPIRARRMSLELRDVGKPVSVLLPTQTIEGNLSILRNRGFGAGKARQAS